MGLRRREGDLRYDPGVNEYDFLNELERRLGYSFEDRGLLEQALRHGSSTQASQHGSYERLEFLGDAVLGHAVAELLYHLEPDGDQGDLTRIRSYLTRSSTLAAKAQELDLDRFIEIGLGEEAAGGRNRQALLEDTFEAIVGALAVDGGWGVALDFVESVFAEDLQRMDARTLVLGDPKTALQEAAQARGLGLPDYREIASQGPDHQRLWVFKVIWDGSELARGEGKSKREAQQHAARRALIRLGLVPEE
ncbi:MAG: ribonuclease III [bacterium]|nr:ribonuclease III [bacterium]